MPRLAATVMLVRPAASAPHIEVFMLRRSTKSAFAPDAFVFPGGTLDPADSSDRALATTYGVEPGALRRIAAFAGADRVPDLPSEREFAGLYVTALRELFEEAGVLLACSAGGVPLPPESSLAAHTGSRDYQDVLTDLHALGDARALRLFSRWITPNDEPRRYDAYFFAALTSREQTATADARETHDGVWIEPREALARYAAGSFRMIYPTIKHVERLEAFSSGSALMSFAAVKPVHTIMPRGSLAAGLALPREMDGAW